MQSPGQPLDARDRVEITFYLSLRFALRLKVDIKRLSAPRSGLLLATVPTDDRLMLTSCPPRRTQNHIRHLLELIAQFPRVNPSAAAAASDGTSSEAEVDIPRLFRQIRSRYKLLCATLGVRPTMRAADGSSPSPDRHPSQPGDDLTDTEMLTQTQTEPARPVRAERKKVWAVHDARADRPPLGGTELNF